MLLWKIHQGQELLQRHGFMLKTSVSNGLGKNLLQKGEQ